MAHPRGVEPLTPRSVVWCSIQLSYGRVTGAAAGTKPARRILAPLRPRDAALAALGQFAVVRVDDPDLVIDDRLAAGGKPLRAAIVSSFQTRIAPQPMRAGS